MLLVLFACRCSRGMSGVLCSSPLYACYGKTRASVVIFHSCSFYKLRGIYNCFVIMDKSGFDLTMDYLKLTVCKESFISLDDRPLYPT